jgi:hypothetical protein
MHAEKSDDAAQGPPGAGPILDEIRLCVAKRKNRTLSRLIPVESLQDQACVLIFATYCIPTSSMSYSNELMEAREAVDRGFSETVSKIIESKDGCTMAFFDSSGHPVSTTGATAVDILDVMDAFSESRIFQTLELGCCRTYSHHQLKTRGLTCLIVISGPQEALDEMRLTVWSLFTGDA